MRSIRAVSMALGIALVYGASAPLEAGGGTVPYQDAKRGFSTRIPDTFKQVPPQPTGDPKFQAAAFYDDMAKYKSSGSSNPEFMITWWVTTKSAVTPRGAATAPPEGGTESGPDRPQTREEAEDSYLPKSQDELLDWLIERNTRLFGSKEPPMAERWAAAKSGKTTKQKIDFRYLELNTTKPKKRDESAPMWYLFAAKLTLERPTETVDVGFHASCATEFAKDLGPAFLNVVKSFEMKGTAGSAPVREVVPTDPDEFREFIKKTKVIKGWKCKDSPKKQYLLLYDDDVKDVLIQDVGQHIEGIREQVYERLFPPGKPVTAVSVIRVCKDAEQYRAYGGPGGSAGYWSDHAQELVFYEDSQDPKNALRVLYHEAFHQYIFYSVGALSPHSWFNEGHGDFFAGHNHKGGGRFELNEFLWRKDLAATLKRTKRTVPLREWLGWSQQEYYGGNKHNLGGGENYALGWNFVYFLRTTKVAYYQGLLDRYFNTLKGLVTKAREERRKEREKAKAAGEDPGEEIPEDLANRAMEDEWCATALKAMLQGVDVEQLEKDWLAF